MLSVKIKLTNLTCRFLLTDLILFILIRLCITDSSWFQRCCWYFWHAFVFPQKSALTQTNKAHFSSVFKADAVCTQSELLLIKCIIFKLLIIRLSSSGRHVFWLSWSVVWTHGESKVPLLMYSITSAGADTEYNAAALTDASGRWQLHCITCHSHIKHYIYCKCTSHRSTHKDIINTHTSNELKHHRKLESTYFTFPGLKRVGLWLQRLYVYCWTLLFYSE